MDGNARRVRNALNMQKGGLRRVVQALEAHMLSPNAVWEYQLDIEWIIEAALYLDVRESELTELTDLIERYKRFQYQ